MKKVKYFKWVFNKSLKKSVKEVVGIAQFHQFGTNCEDGEVNFGNFSTAIIELEDGTVENIPAENIQFIK